MRNIATIVILATVLGSGVVAGQALKPGQVAEKPTPSLLDGCGDVPEAVALAQELTLRRNALDRSAADLERRRAELAAAQSTLQDRLGQLRRAQKALKDADMDAGQSRGRGIEQLIAVYDAMKPAEAAEVLAALPPDFAAEILARVQPETGARIIAAIEPSQAAVLTARLGTRRVPEE